MWILLSLGSAFFDSIKNIYAKKVSFNFDAYTAVWAQRFFSLFVLVPIMLFHIPAQLDYYFWGSLGIVIVLDTAASLFFIKAIKKSPLSLVLPLTALTPVFILFFSIFVNKEWPALMGLFGILLSVVGVYILQIDKKAKGWLEPFKEIFRDRGLLLAFLVAVIWGISSTFDKVAVQHSNGYFFSGLSGIIFTLVLTPFVFKSLLQTKVKHFKQLALFGTSQGISVLLQMIALPLTFVSYVVAIKLSSSSMGVLFGKLIFKEEHFKERMVGSLIILVGIFLIIFS